MNTQEESQTDNEPRLAFSAEQQQLIERLRAITDPRDWIYMDELSNLAPQISSLEAQIKKTEKQVAVTWVPLLGIAAVSLAKAVSETNGSPIETNGFFYVTLAAIIIWFISMAQLLRGPYPDRQRKLKELSITALRYIPVGSLLDAFVRAHGLEEALEGATLLYQFEQSSETEDRSQSKE